MAPLQKNGDELVGGSCGSPITDREGEVLGLFRCITKYSSMCLSVSATALRDFGYEIYGGVQTSI